MAFAKQAEIKLKPYSPHNPKRAKQYPQVIWDSFWSKIQAFIDKGFKYEDVLEAIKRDGEAITAGFHPTLPQLERQLRRTHPILTSLDRPCTVAQPRMNERSGAANKRAKGPVLKANASIVPIRHSPLPHDRFREYEEFSDLLETPSFGSDSASDPTDEAQTPPASCAQAFYLEHSQHVAARGLLSLDIPIQFSRDDLGLPSDAVAFVNGPWTCNGEAGSQTLLDRDLELKDDEISLSGEVDCSKPWPYTDRNEIAASETSTQSSRQLFGSSRIFEPIHKQPLKLDDEAKALLRLGPSPNSWLQYLRAHPEVLKTDPADFFDAAVQAREGKLSAEPRSCLDCMNLVWASRLLGDAMFHSFMHMLSLDEMGQGCHIHQRIAKTFFRATEQGLAHLDDMLSSPQYLISPQSCCFSVVSRKLPPPVVAEVISTAILAY